MKAHHADPANKAVWDEAHRKLADHHANPANKSVWDEAHRKQSATMADHHANPANKALWAEAHRKQSATMKANWLDPIFKLKYIVSRKGYKLKEILFFPGYVFYVAGWEDRTFSFNSLFGIDIQHCDCDHVCVGKFFISFSHY